ncbi:hypothetical protein H4R19_003389 [Coemansia spiralis]|nr:hypothetical protein H4R19_003389 [Coemansia spiralis]
MHFHRHDKGKASGGTGIIFTMASDYVHPDAIPKESISPPVSAAPMGPIDITAVDGAYCSSEPSAAEVHALHKHARQTAHALGTRHRKSH